MTFFKKDIILFILLVAMAAIPRFNDLGKLGFYGDEETTSTAAKNLIEKGTPQMNSGMPYHRAIIHTYSNAMFAKLLGKEKELSYRVFSAVLGTLTIPLLFFGFRPLVGATVAFLAASLLGLSDWHVTVSREARMYGPFLFFYLLSSILILKWVVLGRRPNFYFSMFSFTATLTSHLLGIFIAVFGFFPYLLQMKPKVRIAPLVIVSLSLVGCTVLYRQLFTLAPYLNWKSLGVVDATVVSKTPLIDKLPKIFSMLDAWFLLPALFGLVLGILLARVTRDKENNPLFQAIWFCLLTGAGVLAGMGQIYGFGLMLLVSTLLIDDLADFIKKGWKTLAGLVFILVITSIVIVVTLGYKATLSFPFPYIPLFALQFPVLIVVFLGTTLHLSIRPQPEKKHIKLMALAAYLPIVGEGLVKENWNDLRYLLISYPFILLVAASGVKDLVTVVLSKVNLKHKATVTMTFIVLSGVIGGHGLLPAYRVATLDYGGNIEVKDWPYPDHKSAGEFVRARLKQKDIVIAEDMLEQGWYVGRVDYWLRDFNNVRQYLLLKDDGSYRDIYVNSIVIRPQDLDFLKSIKDRRIWVITSAETSINKEYFLSADQFEWLNGIKGNYKPVHEGDDGITQVFLLNGSL